MIADAIASPEIAIAHRERARRYMALIRKIQARLGVGAFLSGLA